MTHPDMNIGSIKINEKNLVEMTLLGDSFVAKGITFQSEIAIVHVQK